MSRREARPDVGRRGARGGLGRQLARAGVAEVRRRGGARRGRACRRACGPEIGRRPPIIGLTARTAEARPTRRSGRPTAGHRRLDRRDVVGGPPPGRGLPASVSSSIQPAVGIAVPRLADAARVEQHAPAVERRARDPAPGLIDLEPPVVLDVGDREVGVAVQAVARGRAAAMARAGDRRRGDVLPGRVARAAVDQQERPRARASRAGRRARPRVSSPIAAAGPLQRPAGRRR